MSSRALAPDRDTRKGGNKHHAEPYARYRRDHQHLGALGRCGIVKSVDKSVTLAALLAGLLSLHPTPPAADPSPAPVPSQVSEISYRGTSYPLYPATMSACPDIPSPFTTPGGREIVSGFRDADEVCTLVDLTVENGAPRNYKESRWGKGEQLRAATADFPALAKTGLHSAAELDRIAAITGRPVDEITAAGRPGGASTIGFMAPDEDIISVLKGDDRLVRRLGLTHPELARATFHLWNLVRAHDMEARRVGRPVPVVDRFLYNGNSVHLIESESGKGWQESIFNDGNLGMFTIRIRRDLEAHEEAFLRHKYRQISDERFAELTRALTEIRMGEMVAYYIQRYGFYEGHTGWRAGPIAIAFIFGLLTIEEIDGALEGNLHEALTRHHTPRAHN